MHQGTAATTGSGNRGTGSDDSKRLDLCRIERKQIAVVLEQDNTLCRPMACHGSLCGGIDFTWGRWRAIEHAAHEHRSQYAAYVFIKSCHSDPACGYFGQNFLGREPVAAITNFLWVFSHQPRLGRLSAGHL